MADQFHFNSTDNSFHDHQLRLLRENDASFRSLSLNLNRMEKDCSQQLAHWRESLFSFQIERWAEVIQYNNFVETVIVDMSVSEGTIWKKRQLGTLMDAIGRLPKLKKLVIRQNSLGRPHRIAPMEAIVRALRNCHKTLECFELWGNEIRLLPTTTDLSLKELAWYIATCRKLKCLKFMGFNNLNRSMVGIFVALMNIPTLTEFGLGNTSDGFIPVAQAIQFNTHIEKLTLSFDDDLEDSSCFALVAALQYNSTLQALSLLNASSRDNLSGISTASQEALIGMMQHNMTLADFKLRGHDVSDQILFYLKLNRAGRRQLFPSLDSFDDNCNRHGVTRELWVNKVILSREDPDCSFYFLIMNPSVCVP